MSRELLLAHFERISDTSDAIAHLRRFILSLAVRGKLVEQDSSEEPASVLMQRIHAERKELVKKGKGREWKPLKITDTTKALYEIPPSWRWVPLGETVINHLGGGTPSKNNLTYWGGDIRWASVKDVGKDKYIDETIDRITEAGLADSSSNLISPGNLIVVTRMGLGKVSINRIPIAINQDLRALCLSSLAVVEFHYIFFKTHGFVGTGLTVKGIRVEELLNIAFPLPPLAEQYRIVAKVDELMKLCDRFEAARAERESRRDRLTAASLRRLKSGDNAEDLREHASFCLNHFSRLTVRREQINKLRQTILSLAVCGRLVPQDPNEESVSTLLKCISAENARLQKAKNIRAQKLTQPAERLEAETVLPTTWVHAYLQELAYQITDGTHLTPNYTDKGRPFLSAQNVKPFRFMPEKHRFVSDVDFKNYRANRKPERGDVLLTRVGAGIGEAAVLDLDFEFAFYVSLCLIKIPTKYFSPKYLVLWLNSPEGRASSTARTYGKGASQGNLNLGLIRTFKIPVPPLAEQHRIVAKVDELMALCDRLQVQVDTAETGKQRLLEAVLNGVLNDSNSVDEWQEQSIRKSVVRI